MSDSIKTVSRRLDMSQSAFFAPIYLQIETQKTRTRAKSRLSIASAPSVRRLGVGRALLVELLDDLDGRAVEACFLEVRAGNAPALALYESHGFTRLDVRRAYYEDGEDALILVRRSTSAT